jgi:hypothetical protein
MPTNRAYDRRTLESELADPNLCACTVRFYPRTGSTAYPQHRLSISLQRRVGDRSQAKRLVGLTPSLVSVL